MSDPDPQSVDANAILDDLRAGAGFLTRLPASLIGHLPNDKPDFSRAARAFPVVGGAVGIVGGLVLVIASALGEPHMLASALAVGATVLLTGALHEDGLADTADGFGGGASADRKLDIMDDSRIGAYGATALVFSVLIRVAALSALAGKSAFAAALVLVAAEAASRAALVRLWHGLPAARQGGLSDATGTPDDRAMAVAIALAAATVIVTVIPAFGLAAAIAASLLLALASYGFTRLTARQIGGRTGDTLGACQQVAGAAFLVGAAAFA